MTRRSKPSNFGIALLAAALCAAGSSAVAATVSIRATSGVSNSPGSTDFYTTSTPTDVAAPHTVASSVTAFGSTSSGWVEGSAGLIRMDAFTHVAFPSGYSGPPFIPVSQQSNSAVITDALLLSSPLLAIGTPVDLLIDLAFSQIVTASEAQSSYLLGGYFAQFLVSDHLGHGVQLRDDGPGGQADTVSAVLHTFIGQSLLLSAGMFGGTYGEYLDADERLIHADATHSAHFMIDALTPGIEFTADSGHDYRTAADVGQPPAGVAEPPAVALLFVGLAGLVGAIRRPRLRGARPG